MSDTFTTVMTAGYTFMTPSLRLGVAIHEGTVLPQLPVGVPLKMMNRHGLVSGATGTGKTKGLQVMAESLSQAGVPVLIMDIKGDISGIAEAGVMNPKIQDRLTKSQSQWTATAYPTEMLTLSASSPGVKLRATVSEFGSVVLAKMLELNDTQEGILALIFKFADDYKLPLIDIKDLKKVISFLLNEGKSLLVDDYGGISGASTGVIVRKLVELEGQGGDQFFGEPSFDVHDLMRVDANGKGYVNVLRLMDMQSQPKLFSAFMLSLLAEVYHTLPEVGDPPKPKLVIMIDEAHLLFREASKTLLAELETVVKLIRSKGVGLIFCTQLPTDIPASVLSQLGMKIQFALRAFTAVDRKAIKLVAENYPETSFYKTEDLITQLGIGEALVTVLDEKGNPSPLVHTLLSTPQSRMDVITDDELHALVSASPLVAKYEQPVDPESAYEILQAKLNRAQQTQDVPATQPTGSLTDALSGILGSKTADSVARTATNTVVRNVTSQIMRGVLGSILK